MQKVILRKLRIADKKFFTKWWRDKDLLRLTSGVLNPITDQEVEKYFLAIFRRKTDYHFMIVADKKTIGHVSLTKRKNGWYETQIVIGEKLYWNKGYGTRAIELLIKKTHKLGFSKIYLEVRPSNRRAIKTYKKCGFKKIGVKHHAKNKYLPKTVKMGLGQETKN